MSDWADDQADKILDTILAGRALTVPRAKAEEYIAANLRLAKQGGVVEGVDACGSLLQRRAS